MHLMAFISKDHLSYIVWGFASQDLLERGAVLCVCACDDVRIPLTPEFTDNGRTYHAAMACNIYFTIFR